MNEQIVSRTQNNLPKLFGMDAMKGRWIYVILGFAINLCLGAIYSWSVFRKPLQDFFSVGAIESLLPFTVFLVMLAVMMLLSGEPLDRIGPRKIAMLGGILVGLGWFLGSMVTDIRMLTVTYGIIGGSGVGIVFNCPIGVASKWFPDKRGIAVGLTFFGSGLSSVVMAPLANTLIQKYGILPCFSYLGIVFLILLVLLAIPLSFPPEGWIPPGFVPPPFSGSVD